MTAGKAEGGSPVFDIFEFSMLSGVMGEENKFWKNQGVFSGILPWFVLK